MVCNYNYLLFCVWLLIVKTDKHLLLLWFSSVQFSCSVVSNSLQPHELQHARPPCPSLTAEFTQTHVHRVGDAIQPSHPLSSPSSPPPNPSQHQSLFNESTLHMRWPKYWSFSFSISPSKEHPGLISFRMDCKDGLDKGQKWYGPNRSRRY